MQSFLFASRVFKFTGDILNVLLLVCKVGPV